LAENFQSDRVIGCAAMENLEGTQEVCAEEVALSMLTMNVQKNSVHNTQFGSEGYILVKL
jgi:cytidine deaminase